MEGPREPRTIADRYVVESTIGRGGMGEVLRARDLRLERVVALKILPPERVGRGASVERLVREARATAALEHPSIVRIYDVGATGDGGAYLAMELVRGRSLRALLADGPLSWRDAAPLLVDIASALAHAHHAGVIRRDVKPDNVLVRDADGHAIVLDFGLAKLVRPDGEQATTLTAEGAIVGTPAYLAPEQARGLVIDARADQFAFGVLVYELLVGAVPWSGTNVTSVLAAVLTETAPAIPDDRAPTAVVALVARLLAKDPADRFTSFDDVVAILERESRSSGSTAEPFGPTDEAVPKTRSNLSHSQVAIESRASNAIGRVANAPSPKLSRLGTIALLSVLGFAALVAVIVESRVAPRPATRASNAADRRDAGASSRGRGLLDEPDPPGCNAPAKQAYRAGIVALHRGDWGEADAQLATATHRDPACAAALLRHAIIVTYTYRSSAAREPFRRAAAERASLDARLSAMLDAYEPMWRDPPDPAEHGRRMRPSHARSRETPRCSRSRPATWTSRSRSASVGPRPPPRSTRVTPTRGRCWGSCTRTQATPKKRSRPSSAASRTSPTQSTAVTRASRCAAGSADASRWSAMRARCAL